jgi:TonB-linked SusC/RagA family outer membrane protein
MTVTGTVTDGATGESVPFASIQLKGTMTGGNSDLDGKFSIEVPSDGVLIFSSIGYVTLEVAVAGKAQHEIVLMPDTQQLEETIVVAFGTATKESFTGSATVVKSDDIAKIQTSDVTRALEGHVAGVQMTTASGSLGASPTIQIRGVSSINAGSAPLYIVDGVPYSGDMNNINSSDIESMTVLKDAASNALYGARGANGVIMITTKKAKSGDAVINVDAKWGLNTKALKSYDYITDPGQYYETHYAALYAYYRQAQGMSHGQAGDYANRSLLSQPGGEYVGGLGYNVYTIPQGENLIGRNGKLNPNATLGRHVWYNGEELFVTADDWMKETYRQSLRQEYNVSASGSSDKMTFFASFGYLNNKGIIEGEDMYRYTARLKADYQAKKWLKLGMNAGYTNFNWDNGNSGEGSSGSTANVFAFATSMPSIYPVYIRDAQGNIKYDKYGYKMYDYGDGSNAGQNRLPQPNANALQGSTLNVNNSEGNAFNGTGFAEVSFLNDFKFTFNVGVGLDETRTTSMQNMYYGQFAANGGIISKSHARSFYVNMQQLLNYNKTFAGVHNVSALIGHETYRNSGVSLSATRSKMFSIHNLELDGAIIDGQSSSSSRGLYNNEGFLSRVQYDYMNKIFVSASYRRDASSKFHPDNRWGNFWSLGGGWIINDEPWFNARWIDMLKLKASVGSQGNDNIGSYLYTDTYQIVNSNGEIATPFAVKGNKDITWETNTNFNAGVDYDFFRGKISGSAEYFYRKTSDMLFFFSLATSMGYNGYYDNIGDMRNSGVEFDINANLMRRENFNWDLYFNFTHYTNKITMLPSERKTTEVQGYKGYASGTTFIGEGLPLNTFYMQQYAGVDQNTGESLWFVDVKDDNGNVSKTTTSDYSKATKYLSGNPYPYLYGGFGTNLSFYGFDVSVQFTYSLGGLAYDSGYASLVSSPTATSYQNYHKDVLNSWTPENPSATMPRFQYGDLYTSATSNRFLVPASYLNFQNAQIGYTLPAALVNKATISKIRLYLTCDNIWYCSYRQGLDPRQSLTGATSSAMASPIRTISGGISLTF